MTKVFRYCPSPTGRIHLGQLKAAFLPYVLAKKNNGKFIFRVEDTDQKRNKPEAVSQLMEDLNWLGISYDLGPKDPNVKDEYFQSQRLEIYKKYVDQLLESNQAYKAYDTPEEREEQIKSQRSKGQFPVYFGEKLSAENEKELEAQGRKPIIRIKVERDQIIEFEDKVYGKISVNTNQIGDLPIQKSDGTPMYNFCVVIDDHLMGVTDIVRGFGHISNTSKQVLFYKIFDWEIPNFEHFSDIQNETAPGKLSKRFGAKSIAHYRAEGYLPSALINYMVSISFSFHFENKDDEIMTAEQYTEAVDIDKILHTNAKFSAQKLDWFNGQHIRRLSKDEFANQIINWLENYSKTIADFEPEFDTKIIDIFLENQEILKNALPLVQERVTKFKDIFEYLKFFFIAPDKDNIEFEATKHSIEEFTIARNKIFDTITHLEYPWTHESWELAMRQIADELGWKHGDLFMVLRLLLVGSRFSPPLFESMEILGKEQAMHRINK